MSGLGARSFRCDGTPIEPYGGGDEIDMFDEEGFDSERRRKHHPHKPGRRLERHHPRRKTAHDANMVVPYAYHWVRCIRGACLRDRLGLEARPLLDVCGGTDGVHYSMIGDREKPLPVVCTMTCVADKDHADITISWQGGGYGRFRLTFNQVQHLMFRLQGVHHHMNHMHFVARQNAPPAGAPETEPALTPRSRNVTS